MCWLNVMRRLAYKLGLRPKLAAADTCVEMRVPIVVMRGVPTLLALSALLWLALVTLDDKADATRSQHEIARELHGKEAPVLAGQLGLVQLTTWRRTGGFATSRDELVAGLDPGGRKVLVPGHRIDTWSSGDSYVVEVDGFRLAADYGGRSVVLTCNALEESGCAGGQWRSGVATRYLLP